MIIVKQVDEDKSGLKAKRERKPIKHVSDKLK
jgi:hypothetical protein